MSNLIITGANSEHFHFLELFVKSLRQNGRYDGHIVVCDNTIGGKWNEPGKYSEFISFKPEQMTFLKDYGVELISYHELVKDNGVERQQIDKIPSYTQRYPHKFVYATLISKLYLQKVKNICFFDADIYFQKPVAPIFDSFADGHVYMVKEHQRIGVNPFLKKWVSHSDFSDLSNQALFEKSMFDSENYCTGFFGGRADSFHRLSLLSLLLTSNQFVEFYSDQPLMNILKGFFYHPIQDLSNDTVLHLGDLPKEDLMVKDKMVYYRNKASIAVHFNGGTKDIYDMITADLELKHSPSDRILKKVRRVVAMKTAPLRKYLKLL